MERLFMGATVTDIYGGRDPRELAAYSIPQAAHYLLAPAATLRYWMLGRRDGKKAYKPLIHLAQKNPPALSFFNLVEAHVLSALRREHRIPLQGVRRALDYVKRRFPGSPYPLADENFKTNGMDLFVEKFGQIINVSQEGQIAIREVMEVHLRRVEYEPNGLARKLYPFVTPRQTADEPRIIVIDPRISFGRPIMVGTGVPTDAIADRYLAGETPQELAKDYGATAEAIDTVIRCEFAYAKKAA